MNYRLSARRAQNCALPESRGLRSQHTRVKIGSRNAMFIHPAGWRHYKYAYNTNSERADDGIKSGREVCERSSRETVCHTGIKTRGTGAEQARE